MIHKDRGNKLRHYVCFAYSVLRAHGPSSWHPHHTTFMLCKALQVARSATGADSGTLLATVLSLAKRSLCPKKCLKSGI